ncbi:50S ribosomal protein L11 methyltransferase [Pseudobacteriovorax antillogorgiicola]|uniref:Ribosomal protein L11 methyltransferase n=1 Tax=Pseudobacteriovorax antillogorgiicola TaxID=1513793 RepID=A0A1Y6B555_9BACT|nr:50S ribosomal protein L11 methyltransferase [Pseudobacteriovorax antillogorgiicola]TCS59440.1 ribosomal protein L11 methyltransferase [Pseudobacteriovorax antillogorgiicola]SME88267.1 ribosomal protein L11 methyltransferase [Pseudobacteriovorax antillogorgiicola]
MHPNSTYELRISFQDQGDKKALHVKEDVKQFLISIGEATFVEGVVDGLDLDFDYDHDDRDYYEELGGAIAPLSIYKYDKSHLQQIEVLLSKKFGEELSINLVELDTQEWMEGWKDSFKPFTTERFFVYPPWESVPANEDRMPLMIEPGMAFGTGQHATTQLCLQEIERHGTQNPMSQALDVGTGTGILAIALLKLGCKQVLATDIDPDAVIATRDNARENAVSFEVRQESVPSEGAYDLVIANILFTVIRRILDDLIARVQPGGHLLLSGILAEEEHEIDPLVGNRLSVVRKQELNGWVSLLYRKDHGAPV